MRHDRGQYRADVLGRRSDWDLESPADFDYRVQPAASISSLSRGSLSVTICGQRTQAARPSCCHHRQLGRSRHGGRVATTVGSTLTILRANWQFVPSKCQQATPAHGAAMRKTSVGLTGAAISSSSLTASCGSTKYAKRGFSAVPRTTPKTTLPAISGCALGQSNSGGSDITL